MSAQPEDIRPAELDEAAIVAWARRTRAAKGLPPKVEDPAIIRRIMTLAFGTCPPNGSADPNSKGPGLTNRDLRNTTPRTTEKVVAS